MRVSLAGVVRSFGAHTVLDRVDLTLGPRSRLGLVGPNGAGKSTLLRLAAGLDEPDEGTVERTPASLTVGYLPQEHDRRRGRDAARLPRAAHRRRGGRGGASKRHTADWSPDAYAAALERFLALGGGDLEPRARRVCAELGLPVSLEQETATLSGGEAARAALAAILLSRFDVLLLDEPTNDLDFDGLDRLERFVDGFAGGLAVVSHDRAFLDRTVTRSPRSTRGPAACASSRAAGATTQRRASAPARRSTPPSSDAQERRHELEALLHARRNQARAGGGFLASDRRLRPARHARAGRQGAPGAARARADRARREAVRAVAAAALARRGAAARRPRRVARGRRRRARRLPARAGRPRPRARASGSRSPAATAAASRRCSRSCSASSRSPRGAGRRPRDRPRRARPAPRRLRRRRAAARRLRRAHRAQPGDARTLLAKFGLGADHVERPCATLSPGERTRAHLAS